MTTSTPTRDPVTLPDTAELERAIRLLAVATENISRLAWRTRRLRDVEAVEEIRGDDFEQDEWPAHRRQPNDPVPTFEELGRLLSYGISLHGYLEELHGYVNDLCGDDTLRDLDHVRIESIA